MLILIVYFKVSNIARPSEYENAIRSKERAREDIQVMLDDRNENMNPDMTPDSDDKHQSLPPIINGT